MLAIQANEQGHPVLVEIDAERKKFVAVDSERWFDILAEGDVDPIETPRVIIPVHLRNEFEDYMFDSSAEVDQP